MYVFILTECVLNRTPYCMNAKACKNAKEHVSHAKLVWMTFCFSKYYIVQIVQIQTKSAILH